MKEQTINERLPRRYETLLKSTLDAVTNECSRTEAIELLSTELKGGESRMEPFARSIATAIANRFDKSRDAGAAPDGVLLFNEHTWIALDEDSRMLLVNATADQLQRYKAVLAKNHAKHLRERN
jgi:hypothetical protein